MVDAIDHRFTVGDEAGDHQSRRRAQVGRHDGCALQALDAAHERAIALDRDLGAEALQLERMHEAVLEDGLGDHGGALRDGGERHELRLHVGREARIGRGAHAHSAGAAGGLELDGGAIDGDASARFAQFLERRVEGIGRRAEQTDAAARRGGGGEVGAGLDAVRHHRVLGTVQRANAIDADDVAARALDARAHRAEATSEVEHLRLSGRILDERRALGEGGRHHQVLGARHGHHVHDDARTTQPLGHRVHVAVLDVDRGAHRLQAFHVLVDRPQADGAAAGE